MAYSLKLYFLYPPSIHLKIIIENYQYDNFIALKHQYLTENPNFVSRLEYAKKYNNTCKLLTNIFENAGIICHVFKPIK